MDSGLEILLMWHRKKKKVSFGNGHTMTYWYKYIVLANQYYTRNADINKKQQEHMMNKI